MLSDSAGVEVLSVIRNLSQKVRMEIKLFVMSYYFVQELMKTAQSLKQKYFRSLNE